MRANVGERILAQQRHVNEPGIIAVDDHFVRVALPGHECRDEPFQHIHPLNLLEAKDVCVELPYHLSGELTVLLAEPFELGLVYRPAFFHQVSKFLRAVRAIAVAPRAARFSISLTHSSEPKTRKEIFRVEGSDTDFHGSPHPCVRSLLPP